MAAAAPAAAPVPAAESGCVHTGGLIHSTAAESGCVHTGGLIHSRSHKSGPIHSTTRRLADVHRWGDGGH